VVDISEAERPLAEVESVSAEHTRFLAEELAFHLERVLCTGNLSMPDQVARGYPPSGPRRLGLIVSRIVWLRAGTALREISVRPWQGRASAR
jgi:hypothetical protein